MPARYFCVVILVVSGFLTTISQAALLPPGSSLPNAGGPTAPPVLGPIFTSITSPFTTADLTGTIKTDVYANDTNNPQGGLTFIYSIHNNSTSTDSVGRTTVNNYSGWGVDASFLAVPAPFVVPNLVNRGASGDVVGWNFDATGLNSLAPNVNSVPLVLRTSALNFGGDSASVIDGSATSVAAYGPASGILPEPATMGLLALAGMLITRRR